MYRETLVLPAESEHLELFVTTLYMILLASTVQRH